MKLTKITQYAAVFGLCAATAQAASNDALLDLLVEKGVLSKTEASAVAAELKEENKGVAFSAKGKETVKLRFNGRMHFQYDSLDMDENGSDLASSNHFYFRRLRLGAKATHESGIFAETVLDFAGDEEPELGVDKAIAGYKFSDAFTGIVGYQKVPFGFQETTSSSKIKTIERSAANRFFADDIDFAGRHTGLHAKGKLGSGFSYAAAVVNAAQGEGSRLLGESNSDNDMAVFGRLRWSGNGLTVGVDGGAQSNNTKVYTGREDDGDPATKGDLFGVNDVVAFTGYANYKFEGFDILGEYFTGDLDDAGDVDGYAIRVAYKLNDKFEPVFRYSHIKADKFEIDTDELIRRAPKGGTIGGLGDGETFAALADEDNEIDSYYFGLNYYHNKAVSFMLGYEIADAENGDGTDEAEVDGLRARLQILW